MLRGVVTPKYEARSLEETKDEAMITLMFAMSAPCRISSPFSSLSVYVRVTARIAFFVGRTKTYTMRYMVKTTPRSER